MANTDKTSRRYLRREYLHKKASDFVRCAFYLLDRYDYDKNSSYVGSHTGLRLDQWHTISISNKGNLILYEVQRREKDWVYKEVIGHTFNNAYSQEVYVGKLLATYMQSLENILDEIKLDDANMRAEQM